jgi:CheY-like chemotaxis protein
MQGLSDRPKLKGIALSGFGMDEDVRKSREAGFVMHLTKPISFKVLAQAIKDVLG